MTAACDAKLSSASADEANAIYSKLRSYANSNGVQLPNRDAIQFAPSSTSCCYVATTFGTLSADRKGQVSLKKDKEFEARIILLHSTYDHRSGRATPTFGTAVVGGVLGHFATTSWTGSSDVAHCPLGTASKGGAPIPDAIGLLATKECYLQPQHTPSASKGTLIFDGVDYRPLLECSTEKGSDVFSVIKSVQSVSSPGFSIGLAFFLGDGKVHPLLCQGQRDVRSQTNVFVSPMKPVGAAVIFMPLSGGNPMVDQLFLRTIREKNRSSLVFSSEPEKKAVELSKENILIKAFSLGTELASSDGSAPFSHEKKRKKFARMSLAIFTLCFSAFFALLTGFERILPLLVLASFFVPISAQSVGVDAGTRCAWRREEQCLPVVGCSWGRTTQQCIFIGDSLAQNSHGANTSHVQSTQTSDWSVYVLLLTTVFMLFVSNWDKIQRIMDAARSALGTSCSSCGAQFLTSVKFCTACGTPMKEPQGDPKPKSKPSSSESKPEEKEVAAPDDAQPSKDGVLQDLLRRAANKPRAADEVSVTSNRTGDASFACPVCESTKTVLKFELLYCAGCGLNITMCRLEKAWRRQKSACRSLCKNWIQ